MKFIRPFFLGLATALALGACAQREPSQDSSPAPAAMRTVDTPERPGLGTGWGEHRFSAVEPAYFARAWADRPSGMHRLFYNDREGVDATMAFLGGDPKPAAGLQPAANGLLRLGLRDASGRWYDTFDLRSRRFAVGERGARYELVLKNETRRRVEVVVSVDGLDTFDGNQASVAKRGYVLAPGETVAIEGFRTGPESVAAFRFTSMGETVSAQKHRETTNVGVIGVAVFTERFLGTPANHLKAEHRAWRILDGPRPRPLSQTDA